MRSSSVAVLLLYICLIAGVSGDPRLCALLTKFKEISPPSLDGMTLTRNGGNLFDWVPQTCSALNQSFSGTGQGSTADVTFQFDQDLGAVTEVTWKESLQVDTTNTSCTFDLKLEFNIRTASVTLNGFISFTASNLSWGALPFAAWNGQIKSVAGSSTFVYDSNLFDGKKAVVFTSQQVSSPAVDWQKVYEMSGHINAHMDSSAATISGFPGSIRGIFLTPDSEESKLIHSSKGSLDSRSGEFRHLQQTCNNDTACSTKIIDLIVGLLRSSNLNQHCRFEPDHSSFYSELNVQLFGTSSLVKVLNVNALTRLSVECDGPSEGRLEFQVSIASKEPWAEFPLTSFKEERVILDMIRSNSFQPNGMIAGTLLKDGNIKTINSMDLFEGGRGGYPMTDNELTDQSVLKNILQTIPGLIKTNVQHIDSAVSAIFTQKDWVNLYSRVNPYPTHFGFFQWFVARNPELTLFVSFNEKLSFNLVMFQELPFSLQDSAFNAISDAFRAVQNKYNLGNIPNLTDPSTVQYTHSSTQFIVHAAFQISEMKTVSLQAPPRFAALCKLRADVTGNLVKQFSLTHDYTDSTTTLSVVSIQEKVYHLKADGKFVEDKSVYSHKFKRHLQALVKGVGDLPWINQQLSPLNVILGEVGSQTIDVTLQDFILRDWFPNEGLSSQNDLEDAIQSHITAHQPLIVTTNLRSGSGEGFFIEISVKRLAHFSVTEFSGLEIPLNNNTKFPAFFEVVLKWEVPNGWGVQNVYPPLSLSATVKGGTEIVGWTASFSQGMLSGFTEGNLGFQLDIPKSATLSIATWIYTPHGLLVTTIQGENLGTANPALNIINNGDASDAMMMPGQALTAFQMVPKTNQIFDGPFHVRFPLHTDEVFSLSTVDEWLESVSRWLQQPMIRSPALVSTIQFCIQWPKNFEFQVSVNQKPRQSCSVTVGGRGSLDEEAQNFNNRIKSCGLGDSFFAEGVEVSYDNKTCGSFVFRPKVPGSIWNFEMNDTSRIKFLGSNATRWSAQAKPLFSNWYDFAQLINTILPDLSVTPVFTKRPVSKYPYLIPAEIHSYFPTDVRSVYLDISLSNLAKVSFAPPPTVSSPTGNVVVNFRNNTLQPMKGTLQTNYSFGINAMLTGLPFGGGNGICVLSDIEGDPRQQTLELFKSRFVVTFQAYKRDRQGFENLQHTVEINLPPLLKFYDTLVNWIQSSPSIPDWVRQIWQVRIDWVSSPSGNPTEQVFLCLNRATASDGKMIIPLGISISYSQLSFLANASLIPGRGSISISDFTLSARSLMSSSQIDASGRLGIVPYTSEGNVILASNLSYLVKTHKDMIPLATLTKASQDRQLFKYFKTNFDQETSLTMKVEVDPFVPIGGFPSDRVQLFVSKSFVLDDLDDEASKSSKFENMLTWDQRFLEDSKKRGDPISDAVAKNLLNFEKNLPKVANYLTGLENQLKNLLSTELPLIPNNLQDLYQKVLGKYFNQFNNLIQSTPDLTIPFFCKTLDDVFKGQKKDVAQRICKFIDVQEETLSFDLSFVIGNMIPTQFKFDSKTFLKTQLPLPQALGPIDKTQLEMLANFSITLIAKIKGTDVTVSLKPGSKMQLSASAGFTGALAAGFGVFPVTFSGLNGRLGPVIWTTTVKEDGKSFANNLNGSCSLSSSLSVNKRGLCSLSLDIPDILKIAQPNGFNFTADCGDGESLVDALIEAMKSSTLVDILLDATQFTNRFTSAIQSVVNFLLRGTAVISKVPVIGPPLREAIEKELKQIMGPEQTKALVARIRRFYTEQIDKLTSQKRVLPADIEEMLLAEVVAGVAEILGVPERVTPYKDGKFDWFLGFNKTFHKPLKGFDFALGKHGNAGFELKSETSVSISFIFNLTLHFDKVKGITTSYPEVPFKLTAIASLDNDLSGKLGFIGAQIDTTGLVTVSLSINNQWRPTVSFKAGLEGDTRLGFAGLADKLFKDKPGGAFKALPQFRAQIELGWNATWAPGGVSPAIVPPTFKMKGVGLCMGQLFGQTLLDVSKTVKEKVLEPFDDVVGPDGLLMKDVEIAKILFGRKMNFAELFGFVAEFLCSEEEDCLYDNVAEAIKAWMTIARQINDFVQILGMDDQGCNIIRKIGDFDLDFTKDNPGEMISRKRLIMDGAGEVEVGPGFEDKKDQINGIFTQFNKDEFGVVFHLKDNIPEALISLLLGKPIPIVGVKIPKLSIGAGISWTIPLYAPPQINLVIGIEASFTVDIGEIVYTSQGITDTIRTKNPAKLVNGLAISTINPDGTPRYIIVIRVKFSAGVEVSIFFVRAEATVYIIIEAKARLVGLTDSPYVPFSEMGWILKQNDYNPLSLFEKRLTVTLGFGIRIRLCFFIGCLDVWTWKYEIVLFDISFPAGNRPPQVADDRGRLNAKAIGIGLGPDDTGIPIMRVYDALDGAKRTIDYMPGETGHAVSKIVSATNPVGLSGTPGQAWRLELLGVRNRIDLPSNLEKATVFLDFPDAEIVHLTRTSLLPEGFATSVLGALQELQIDRSAGFGVANLQGCPGPVKIIGNSAAQVIIGGTTDIYTGQSVTIAEAAGLIDAAIRATTYDITSGLMQAGTVGIHLPKDVQTILAAGDLVKPSKYKVSDVPAERSITVSGGVGDDLFEIPGLQTVNGLLQLTGGGGINSIEVTLDAKYGQAITISPSSVFMDGKGTKHLVKWEAVQSRKVELRGHEKTEVAIINPESGSLLQVTSIGSSSTNIEQRISGCNAAADVRITMKGGGIQTIIIGNNQKIVGFACTVRVTGSADKAETDIIIIEASEETRALTWLLDEGSLQVYPSANNDNWFKLIFTDIERIHIKFGKGGTIFDFPHALDNECEYFLDFDEKPVTENQLRIQQTLATVLISGYVNHLGVGPEKKPEIQAPNPLGLIYGMVALSSKTKANITLNSGVGPKAPVQHMEIINDCIFNIRSDGSRLGVPNPTAWMCGLMKASGFPAAACTSTCPVKFLNNPSILLETGNQNDKFKAANVKALLDIRLGPGNDELEYGPSYPTTLNSHFDLGAGVDLFTARAPIAAATIDLGDDMDYDKLQVFPGDFKPGVEKRSMQRIGPLSPSRTDFLTVNNINVQDVIDVDGKAGVPPVGASPPIIVNAATPGSLVRYTLQADTTYDVINCAEQAIIYFESPTPVLNWRVNVSVPDWRVPCLIKIFSTPRSQGTLNLNVKNVNQQFNSRIVNSTPFSIIDLAAMTIQVQDLKFLAVSSPTTALILRTEGTPTNAEMFILTRPLTSSIELTGIRNNVLVIDGNVKYTPVQTSVTVISKGAAVRNTLVTGADSTSVRYAAGCVNVGSTVLPPSSQFTTLANAHGVSRGSNCIFETEGTKFLEMITAKANVTVSGLVEGMTATDLQITSNYLTLTDTEIWQAATVTGPTTLLTVDSRYKIAFTGLGFSVNSNAIGNNTRLTIDTKELTQRLTIGQESATNVQMLKWTGPSKGEIFVNKAFLPAQFKFVGPDLSFNFSSPVRAKSVSWKAERFSFTDLTVAGKDQFSLTGRGILNTDDFMLWDGGVLDFTGILDTTASLSLKVPTQDLRLTASGTANFQNLALSANMKVTTKVEGLGDFPLTISAANGVLTTENSVSMKGSSTASSKTTVGFEATADLKQKAFIQSVFNSAGESLTYNGLSYLQMKGTSTGSWDLSFTSNGTKMVGKMALVPSTLSVEEFALMNITFKNLVSKTELATNVVGDQTRLDSKWKEGSMIFQNPRSRLPELTATSTFKTEKGLFDGRMISRTHLVELLTTATGLTINGLGDLDSVVNVTAGASMVSSATSFSVMKMSVDHLTGDFNLTRAETFNASVITPSGTGYYAYDSVSLEHLTSLNSNLLAFPHFDVSQASGLTLTVKSQEFTLNTEAASRTTLAVVARPESTTFTEIHSMTSFLQTESETALEIAPDCTSEDPEKCSTAGSTVQIDFTKHTVVTNNTGKVLTLWNKATKFYSDLLQSGTFSSVLDIKTSKIEVSGSGLTDACSFIGPNGHIIVNTTRTRLSAAVDLETIVSPETDSVSINGNHIKVCSMVHASGEFNITTTGQQLEARLSLAGKNTFSGKGKAEINTTLWSIPEIIDNKKRQAELQERTIEINEDNELRILSVPSDLEFLFSNGFSIESLNVEVQDGNNKISLTGPLIPTVKLGAEAVTFIRSEIPINIMLPNDLTYNPANTTIHPSEQDSETCIQPRVVCTKKTWNELSITTLTKLPCNSKLAQLNESCTPAVPNMYLDTSGSHFHCFINDLNESTGWNISVNPLEVQAFGATSMYKFSVVAIYCVHLVVLVVGFVVFGAFATEGWMALAITSFLPRAIPAEGWSTSALAIASSAKFIVRDWWITLTDDGGGVCNWDLSKMVVGWLIIGFAALTILLLILKQYKKGQDDKEYLRRIQIGIDGLSRLFVVLGIFWLAIPVLSHLPIPDSSTPYIGFILLVMLCAVIILFIILVALSTQKPRWMRDPPGLYGYSIFRRSYVNYLFVATMLLFALTPGIMGHPYIEADGIATTVFAIILLFTTVILFLIKSFLLWKEYASPRQDDDIIDYSAPPASCWTHRCLAKLPTVPSVFLGFISCVYVGLGAAFIVLFSSSPYMDDMVFLGLWMAWAGPISLVVSLCAFFPYIECNGSKNEQEIELKSEAGYQQF